MVQRFSNTFVREAHIILLKQFYGALPPKKKKIKNAHKIYTTNEKL